MPSQFSISPKFGLIPAEELHKSPRQIAGRLIARAILIC